MVLLYYLIIFLSDIPVIGAGEYMEDLLNSMINRNLTMQDTCDSLMNSFKKEDMSSEAVRGYSVFFWDIITNHSIFKNMTENNDSIFSFRELRNFLRDAYLKKIKSVFRKTKWNPYLLNKFSIEEKNFIYDMVNLTLEYYNSLRLCYKDKINKANSTVNLVEDIIRENTCFIRNNKSEHLPTFVVKTCTGQLYGYFICYRYDWMDRALKFLTNNQNLLSKAECINDNYDFRNFSLEIITKPMGFAVQEDSYNSVNFSFMIFMGIIICFILTFLGYKYYNKKKTCNKNLI
ncbi:putative SP-containing membrane protein [Vairimorpha necatrix]|uniref:SP-containing membrane protein n=1 Tax=Vairimorpha necatrix TaxID=6039 RepID=A0AAX4JC76_9MICR